MQDMAAVTWLTHEEARSETVYYQIGNTNVRLAGSMHLVPKGSPLPSWVQDAYQWSRVLYLEHDVRAFSEELSRPAAQSLQERLPADIWAQLEGMLSGEQLGRLGTLAAMTAFANSSAATHATDLGLEPILTSQARRDARLIRYLETPAEFAAIADSVDDSSCAQLT